MDILIIDDEPHVCELLEAFLSETGFGCQSSTHPAEAEAAMEDLCPAVIVSDICMPEMTGLQLLGHVRRRNLPSRVILTSGVANTDNLAEALAMGAYDFVAKPFDLDELVSSVTRAMSEAAPASYLPFRAARAMQVEPHLRQVSLESIRALVHAVEAKDPYTRRHSEHVTTYAEAIARRLGADSATVESIRTASLLHDCGKIGVPDSVLTKPGALLAEEFDQIKRHPVVGSEILSHISAFSGEAGIVRAHHERWDGQGYPDGLAGPEIPFGARVVNAADSIDAMLMQRTYKQAYPVETVLEELKRGEGRQFQPLIAQAAFEWLCENADQVRQTVQAA